jgi:hypothetical protein
MAAEFERKVLDTFMEGGRLKAIPARLKKRRVILAWLAEHFRPAKRYSEEQVNHILARYHEDYVALRRYLVDEEFMQRERGEYWRFGTMPYRR